MSMSTKFDALVKNLDQMGLDALTRSVASEIAARGGEGMPAAFNSIHIDTIRPGMTAAEKELVTQEITRVLREQR